MSRTKKLVIEWDGKAVPEALKKAPPGRYVVEVATDEALLSEEEDQGIRDALDQLDAGGGRSLADVIREIRSASVPR